MIRKEGFIQPKVTPDQLMKELVGYSIPEVRKMTIEEGVKLQEKIIPYHDLIETDEKLRSKLVKCLMDSIEDTWRGEDIEKEHVKSINEEKHQVALDWLEKRKEYINVPSSYYNGFVLAFSFNVNEESRDRMGRTVLLAQDLIDLKIPEEKLAHIALTQLFDRIGPSVISSEEEKANPKPYQAYWENRQKEEEKSHTDLLIGEIRDRLVREKRYNPSKLW